MDLFVGCGKRKGVDIWYISLACMITERLHNSCGHRSEYREGNTKSKVMSIRNPRSLLGSAYLSVRKSII